MSKSRAALDIFKNYFDLMIFYRLQTLGSKDEAPALTSPSSFFFGDTFVPKKRSRRMKMDLSSRILQNQTCPRNTIKLFLKLETSWIQRLNPRELFRFYEMSNERSISAFLHFLFLYYREENARDFVQKVRTIQRSKQKFSVQWKFNDSLMLLLNIILRQTIN